MHRLLLTLLFTSLLFALPTETFAAKKIVLIAGVKSHGPGHHEYEKGLKLFKTDIEKAMGKRVNVELHLNDWPTDDKTLDDADSIVMFCDGSNHKDANRHPLLKGDRLKTLGTQMARGCGFVAIHYTVFVPNDRGGEQFMDWLGGYFDFQSGKSINGKAFWSALTHTTSDVKTAAKNHPVLRGVKNFKLKEEFYYKMRFQGSDKPNDAGRDPRVTPLLTTKIPNEKQAQLVAWAVERKDGGRGFVYTGGHYHDNWKNDNLRRTVLNAIVWTAKIDPPKRGGMKIYKPWYEGQQPRWAASDLGPVFSATIDAIESPAGTTFKARAIKLADDEKLGRPTAIFDTELLRYTAVTERHGVAFQTYRDGMGGAGHRVGPPYIMTSKPGPGVANKDGKFEDTREAVNGKKAGPLPREHGKFLGEYRHGDRVVLRYSVGAERVEVLDSPGIASVASQTVFVRHLHVSGARENMALRLMNVDGNLPKATWKATGDGSVRFLVITKGDRRTLVALAADSTGGTPGQGALTHEPDTGSIRLDLGPSRSPRAMRVMVWDGEASQADAVIAALSGKAIPGIDLTKMTKGGPAKWTKPIVTKGTLGQEKGAYVVDTITAPYDNPYKALIRGGGVDFFSNGDAALCTMDGDVWRVSGIDDKLEKITWKRYATGLFHALGLRVLNDKVYVLCRDQITLLHDYNGDNEVDYYENFNNDLIISNHVHEYATNLGTDPQGNFYFMKGFNGGKDPHDSTCIKVSADGKNLEVFAYGFRWPNGMSVGPDGTVTAADQQGTWIPSSRLDVVTKNGFYGFNSSHHQKEQPTRYDGPLCWIPHKVDNSCGGQAWVTSDKWGLPRGTLLHLSYGRCKLFLVLKEKISGKNGKTHQGGVVEFPLNFLTGIMRGRFNPKDGQLYVTGLKGWQTRGAKDGALQRVRYTGKKIAMPTGLKVHKNGVLLTLPEPLDEELALDPDSYSLEQWQYRWTRAYGSKEFKVSNPDQVGHDPVAVKGVKLSKDRKHVFLDLGEVNPVMQMKVAYDLEYTSGEELIGAVHNTIHEMAPAFKGFE